MAPIPENYQSSLDNDNVGEATGDIKLTLNENSIAYRLGSVTEGVITIWDDDAPELKITAGLPITETVGVKANFVVSAEVSPNKNVTVRYDLTESEDFIDNEGTSKIQTLGFSNNVTEATLSIAIDNDDDEEANGTITVTLTPDTSDPLTYTLASSPNNSADVIIYDDDSPPTIAITADSGKVAENAGPARFKLTATGLVSTETIIINATPAEDGSDFLTNEIADSPEDFSVRFTDPDKDSTFDGEFEVTLDDDLVGEATGEIKLTLNQSPVVYRLGSTTEGNITILDDDAPELEITAGDRVFESDGVFANFMISAEVSPNEEVRIRYDLTESHNFVGTENEGNGITKQLDFSGGVSEATLPIPITNDTMIEDDGTITVTLVPDQAPINYTVASAPNNTATVEVVDDDSYPLITIAPINGEVPESNGIAQFTVMANRLERSSDYKCQRDSYRGRI